MQASCAHDELEVGSDIDALSGPDGDFLSIRLRVRCSECGQLFSFRGLNSGVANPYEPVTSADGFELRAPIVPRPGGVVGVLALANLEDELRDETLSSGGVDPPR